MKINKELAEVTGVILGDGCLSEYYVKSEQRRRQEIAFTGSNEDFLYYKEFVRPVFIKFFGTKGRLFIRKDDNSTRFHVINKPVFEFFHSMGLPSGKKPSYLKIPNKIMKKQCLSLACVRGIWNTDGSIYRRFTKRYPSQKKFYGNYLVMQLKMNTKPLLTQVKKILNVADIGTTSITKENKAFVLRITKQTSISRYLTTIGFSNKHHSNRIKSFNIPATVKFFS
ncbi:MAG: hypothetical protein ABIE23_03570 [archaeon]